VFVSNYMKQQRNFVKYRRQKNLINGEEDGEANVKQIQNGLINDLGASPPPQAQVIRS